MIDNMGIFRTNLSVANPLRPDERAELSDVMVDTGSEYNWVPQHVLEALHIEAVRSDRFETADGRVIERRVGFALLFASGRSTATVVVFGERGDSTVLGAHGLEGLNLRVDLVKKELITAGLVPAAAAA